MTGPVFTMACQRYDRMLPLAEGTVPLLGAQLNFLDLPVEETFFRMLRFHEFDIAELSLSSYVMSLEQGNPFVAVPVFPSRAFRHSGIYVRSDSELTELGQLSGCVVGVPEYQITASVWIRGILADYHGVPVDSVHYRTGGLDEPGRTEKLSISPPAGVDVTAIAPGATLSQLLLDGELDAVYTARNPGPFNAGAPIRRLLADPQAAELDYYARTGIFPIMHTLVIRREVYEQHPWLAREMVKACEESKRIALRGLAETVTLKYALPWLWAESERTRNAMGDNWWPYGLDRNYDTLTTFLNYHAEQGLSPRRYEPEELFAPESLAVATV